jgi:teichuronic acid biosynthesis glycosyltransferase TuaC
MKVLIICSGKSGKPGEVVKNQGDSLISLDIDISYFLVEPGLWGYLRSIPLIRQTLKTEAYDVTHAHYSFSGFAAAFAKKGPLVVSLMGSDIMFIKWQKLVCRLFAILFWDRIIVKSEQMKVIFGIQNVEVIPNGVDLDRFKPICKSESRRLLNISSEKQIVLFIGGKDRPEKNYALASAATDALKGSNVELLAINNVPNEQVPFYINASDVLLLTSLREGSANVVKEAMACCCPVVATRVVDVEWLFGSSPGHYITGFSIQDVAKNIEQALEYAKQQQKTQGRNRIVELGLDSQAIAMRLVRVYNNVY